MNNILKRIFEEQGFTNERIEWTIDDNSYIDLSRSFLSLPKDDRKKTEYYLTIFLKNPSMDQLEDLVNKKNFELFSEIKFSNIYIGDMDKNLSMLVCIEMSELENEEKIINGIYNIEEDQYNFKKYVLTYSANQEIELKEKTSQEMNVTKFLQEVVIDVNKFELFKQEVNKEALYSLVSKLFIKIPILTLNKVSIPLVNLKEIIEESLKEDSLIGLAIRILELDQLKDMDEDSIIIKLEGE